MNNYIIEVNQNMFVSEKSLLQEAVETVQRIEKKVASHTLTLNQRVACAFLIIPLFYLLYQDYRLSESQSELNRSMDALSSRIRDFKEFGVKEDAILQIAVQKLATYEWDKSSPRYQRAKYQKPDLVQDFEVSKRVCLHALNQMGNRLATRGRNDLFDELLKLCSMPDFGVYVHLALVDLRGCSDEVMAHFIDILNGAPLASYCRQDGVSKKIKIFDDKFNFQSFKRVKDLLNAIEGTGILENVFPKKSVFDAQLTWVEGLLNNDAEALRNGELLSSLSRIVSMEWVHKDHVQFSTEVKKTILKDAFQKATSMDEIESEVKAARKSYLERDLSWSQRLIQYLVPWYFKPVEESKKPEPILPPEDVKVEGANWLNMVMLTLGAMKNPGSAQEIAQKLFPKNLQMIVEKYDPELKALPVKFQLKLEKDWQAKIGKVEAHGWKAAEGVVISCGQTVDCTVDKESKAITFGDDQLKATKYLAWGYFPATFSLKKIEFRDNGLIYLHLGTSKDKELREDEWTEDQLLDTINEVICVD